MRTTLNLDDDALQALKEYAEARGLALGTAASELVRRGMAAPVRTRMANGFCALALSPGGDEISGENVKRLLEDDV